MERFKRVLKKIFFLPPAATVLIAVPSFVLVFYVLGTGIEGWPAYIAYMLSAYATVITVTGITGIVGLIHRIAYDNPLMKRVMENSVGGRYVRDMVFRGEVSLYFGLAVNICYAAFKLVTGFVYQSIWPAAIGIYYLALVVNRAFLVRCSRKSSALEQENEKTEYEYRCYRTTGILMFGLNVAMGGMIAQMIWANESYSYPGYIIYISAMYAFYAFISAFVNLIRFRSVGRPILSASKSIAFAGAMMSVLALQTAMIEQFGGQDKYFRQMMNTATGSCIIVVAFVIAIYMIINANRQLRGL